MSSKLYPPYIEGKISAQYGNILKIPFQPNRAVGASDYNYIKAQIKTVATNQIIGTYTSIHIANSTAQFNCGADLTIGQFYKIQLAYATETSVGYYSTVGIFKYTGQANIEINGLKDAEVNSSLLTYEGNYSNEDITEKEYSYKVEIYNDDVLFYSSGEIVHDSESGIDKFTIPVNLNIGVRYTLKYIITTINNLIIEKSYYIMDRALSELPITLKGKLIASLNYDDGYVSIGFIAESDEVFSGNFRLLRFTNTDYQIIDTFVINSILSTDLYNPTLLYKDFTIQQGVEYKYALQQYNDAVFSQKLYSNKILADFEDMFLYDGERQLKIRFNPKVSSFKTTLLESKTDTIGGKYPFFFRNGNTAYKDFPISGLISFLEDENNLFLSEKELPSTNTEEIGLDTNLTSVNLMKERNFKLEVLDWLNNGKPKLFRSATEGNYIVRLMNVSLSPTDALGRMLHSFNAQAYEIMENTFENLLNNGLIHPVLDIKQIIITQTPLLEGNTLQDISTVHMVIMGPVDTAVRVGFKDNTFVDIQIGNTQIYHVPALVENPVTSIIVTKSSGQVIVEYDSSTKAEYPIEYEGKKIIGVEYQELGAQYTESINIINDTSNILLGSGYQNFNIMSLTLTAKIPSDVNSYHSNTTLNLDPAGNIYSAKGKLITASADDYKVTIGFKGQNPTVLDLSSNTLYQDLEATYPNRWRLDSFGNITLTCDIFEDGLFQPNLLSLGNNIYANIYYSVAKYIIEEAE